MYLYVAGDPKKQQGQVIPAELDWCVPVWNLYNNTCTLPYQKVFLFVYHQTMCAFM